MSLINLEQSCGNDNDSDGVFAHDVWLSQSSALGVIGLFGPSVVSPPNYFQLVIRVTNKLSKIFKC